jgi:hypothetical protein
VAAIETNLPSGVNINGAYSEQPGLQQTITMCQARLDVGGFERIRQKTLQGRQDIHGLTQKDAGMLV